eukprot:gene13931-15383_t
MSAISLWVWSEPFELGIIPVPPPSKLVHHNLRKLYAYAKNKGKVGYPCIRYFQTCFAITEENSELKLMIAEQYLTCETEEDKANWRNRCTVDLKKFLIFLYVQHAQIISLKTSMVVGEEWPSRARSPDLEGRAGVGAKFLDEQAQLNFVQNHLMEILELLVEPDAYGMGADGDSVLTEDAAQALSFLLSGTNGRDVLSLHDLASRQSETSQSGFSKISRMYSSRKLYKWIRAGLKSNPFGVSGCILRGQRLRGRAYSCDESLSFSMGSSMGEELMRHSKGLMDLTELQDSLSADMDLNASFKLNQGSIANKVITNGNFAPERFRLMIFNQVCKRTVARAGDPLSHSTVKLHRCQYSYMYLLSPLRSVTIEKCHDSMIFLGPVETTVNLLACENVQVFAVTRKLTINSCRKCTFYLFTETQPVIVGSNEDIYFAPYHTFYPSLIEDMISVGLTISHNFWNSPVQIGNESGKNNWDELPGEDFLSVCIPFDMEGETIDCPFQLPNKYQNALRLRDEALENWHSMVREAGLTRDKRKQLQSLVQNSFQEWLKETGNQLLLESLAPTQRT